MMHQAAPKVDLWAHYSASSTATQDRRYIAQANSYLDFISTPSHRKQLDGRSSGSQEEIRGISPSVPTRAIYLEESNAAIQALHSQISDDTTPCSQGQPPCISSGRTCIAIQVQEGESDGDRSATSSSSHISLPHSSHLRTPVIHRVAKRCKFAHDQVKAPAQVRGMLAAGASQNSGALPRAWSSPRNDTRYSHVPESPQEQQPVDLRNEWSSELPTSYSVSDIVSAPCRATPPSIQRSVSDPGPLTALPQGRRAEASERFTQAERESQPECRVGLVRSPAELQGADYDIRYQEREHFRLIHAPPASPSVMHCSTHITDRLRVLGDSPKLVTAYRIVTASRALDPLERGHWSFSIASWPSSLQLSFWSFLEDFIAGGAGGWGIMCSWSSTAGETEKDIIKAFCWGEIAKHTYLLLYVASGSRMKRLAAQWIDAGGEAVMLVGQGS